MISQKDSAVSPVIGVVLMVAVTVALVALVTVTVFDIGDDVSEPADISVSTEVDGGGDTFTVEVVRNENVDKLTVEGSTASQEVISSTGGVGTSADLPFADSADDSASPSKFSDEQTVDVVATVGENEEIVTTIELPDA